MEREINWYELANGGELEQGDILNDIPVFDIPEDFTTQATPVGPINLSVRSTDAIVVSQSCDLIHPGKIEFVAFCPVHRLEDLSTFESARQKENLRQGRFYSYHLLNSCTITGFETGLMVIDFKRVLSLPIALTQKLASDQGPRLRLKSPYKEHFSQGFARYFMRVGLPQDIPPFR